MIEARKGPDLETTDLLDEGGQAISIIGESLGGRDQKIQIEALDLLPLIQVAVSAHMIMTDVAAQRSQNPEANPADQLPERR